MTRLIKRTPAINVMVAPKQLLVILLLIAFLVCLYKQHRARKNKRRVAQIIEDAVQAPPEEPVPVPTVNELLAGLEPDHPPGKNSTSAKDFEEESIARLLGIIKTLKELQIRSKTELGFNAQQEEFDAGHAFIERQSVGNKVANEDTSKEYEVLLYLAYREYVKLQATFKGKQFLQQHFGES